MPGLSLIYEDDISKEKYYEYLQNHYLEMDILILHGMYDETIPFLERYRALRPDGKVYCGLDMNSGWMQNIQWDSDQVQKFANQCDLIATASSALRDALNANPRVNFPCRFIPYGFFDPNHRQIKVDIQKKTNTIITVGRIGSRQKNNQELMVAFSQIAHYIPEWNLKIIGTIEPSFQSFIDEYYTIFPQLRERVIFTGPIYDKEKLYDEYAKAKIFALTSMFEGGTPNVYAEALFHGCWFLTSEIDAANDITKHGELGETYKVGETLDLSIKLMQACMKLQVSKDNTHIQKCVAYADKEFSWERNGKKLTYALLRNY